MFGSVIREAVVLSIGMTATIDIENRDSRVGRVKTCGPGFRDGCLPFQRVYDISPRLGAYHVRVRSEGPEKTIIELFIPATLYNAPLRDLLAKCV
jgi:hypothetical protein